MAGVNNGEIVVFGGSTADIVVVEHHNVPQNVPAGGSRGFALDAVGAINFTTVPTPAALAPGILLLGAIMLRRWRR